jgi:LysM repeat protein
VSEPQEGLRVSESPIARFVNRMGIFTFLGLIASLVLLAVAILVTFRGSETIIFSSGPTSIPIDFGEAGNENDVAIPEYTLAGSEDNVSRSTYFQTNRSDSGGYQAVDYIVQPLDSLFGIAEAHNIEPETLLWANEDTIVNVDEISPGMELKIPPVDGVYYKWKEGDTLESVADEYFANIEEIINWPGNPITDLTNPVIDPGTFVMIPGGEGDFQTWVLPVIPTGSAGVDTSVYGPGGCSGSFGGAGGSGAFTWPTPIHTLTGNDYWDGHLAIDLATDPSTPVYAADSGVVVFSGWANGGYGYMVMLDHNHGYQTLYAHMSSTSVGCGQSVGQGQTIGWGGSSGNSTGNHLHFEVRYLGGYISPWYVLP